MSGIQKSPEYRPSSSDRLIVESPWIAIHIESDAVQAAYLNEHGLAEMVRPPDRRFEMLFHYSRQEDRWRLGGEVYEQLDTDPDGVVRIHADSLLNDKPIRLSGDRGEVKPSFLIGKMLRRVKEYCEENVFFEQSVDSCVLSIPHRNNVLRANCRRIANDAGFSNVLFRDAMISAATAWGLDWPDQSNEFVLVCNLAASRISTVLLRYRNGGFEKIADAVSKNTSFGIDEIDVQVLQKLDRSFSSASPNYQAELEKVKMHRERWSRVGPNGHFPNAAVLINGRRQTICASDFEQATGRIATMIFEKCLAYRADAMVRKQVGAISVVLIGSGTSLPAITRPFEDEFGADCFLWINSEHAIPLGTAWMMRPKSCRSAATEDEKRFYQLYLQSEASGDPQLQFLLARCLEFGKGTARSTEEAIDRYRLAARSGHPEALERLAALVNSKSRGILDGDEELKRLLENPPEPPSRPASRSRRKHVQPANRPQKNKPTSLPEIFDLLNLICRTPYGENWAAVDFDTDSKVSLFTLHPHLLERDPEKVWRSIEASFVLDHPGYLSALGGNRSKKWAITEPAGEKISDLIAVAPFSSDVVRDILHDLLDVLEYFEEHHFIHGDIRPEMLFLPHEPGTQRRVQLGFSPGPLLGDEILLGTRSMKAYAPEWIDPRFGATTAATDLYLLAFTALELLIGPEFDSKYELLGADYESRWVVLHSVASERLPRIEELIPDIAKDLYRFLHCILQRTVAHRPRNAAEARKYLSDRSPTPAVPTLEEQRRIREAKKEKQIDSLEPSSSALSEKSSTGPAPPTVSSTTAMLVSDYAGQLEAPPPEAESVVDKATLSGLQALSQWSKELWSEERPLRRILRDVGRQLHRPIILFSLVVVLLPCFFLAGIFLNTKSELPSKPDRPILALPATDDADVPSSDENEDVPENSTDSQPIESP